VLLSHGALNYERSKAIRVRPPTCSSGLTASASENSTVRVWNANTGEALHTRENCLSITVSTPSITAMLEIDSLEMRLISVAPYSYEASMHWRSSKESASLRPPVFGTAVSSDQKTTDL
jgi:hypothetical protein